MCYGLARKRADGAYDIIEWLDDTDEYLQEIDVVKLIADKYAKKHNIVRNDIIIVRSDY